MRRNAYTLKKCVVGKPFWTPPLPEFTWRIKHVSSLLHLVVTMYVLEIMYKCVYIYTDTKLKKTVRLLHYNNTEILEGILFRHFFFPLFRLSCKKFFEEESSNTVFELQKWSFWKNRSMWNRIYIWGSQRILAEMVAPIIYLFNCKSSNYFQTAERVDYLCKSVKSRYRTIKKNHYF